MRYSEKSFEVRFCAALTAAAMPLNRNPKWFGLTQAQERRVGTDTVLGIGGRLILFQFKAQQKQKVKLDCDQLEKLTAVQKKYPKSTFYIFPEEGDIFTAGKTKCLFPSAWIFQPQDIAPSVYKSFKTVSFTLDATNSELARQSPKTSIPIKNACARFGCFCNQTHHDLVISLLKPEGWLRFFAPAWNDINIGMPTSFMPSDIGIPIARDPGAVDKESEPITSEEQFEALFGDSAGGDLEPGAYGFFIPSK